MRSWMRMMLACAAVGALTGVAGCESDDEEDEANDSGAAGGTTNGADDAAAGGTTNGAAPGTQTNLVFFTNTIPVIDPSALQKPDLKITDLFPVVGVLGMWQVRVTVQNAGTANSKAFEIHLFSNGARVDVVPVPGLLAGKQASFTCSDFGWGCPDNAPDKTLRAVADPANTIKELDETNNARQEIWNCPPL